MTDASRVLVSLRVPAGPERAFTAFTEQIGEWWQPNGLFQFSEGRTGNLAFEPGPDGRLREELLAGVAAPAEAERDSWARLPPGDEVLAAVGARPAYPGAGAEYYERNGAQPSLEINAIHAGEHRTVVPAVAHASVSQRLAPGQDARAALATLERLLREALPTLPAAYAHIPRNFDDAEWVGYRLLELLPLTAAQRQDSLENHAALERLEWLAPLLPMAG